MREAGSILFNLLLMAAPAGAADYDAIERRLAKEPVYQTKTPKYALRSSAGGSGPGGPPLPNAAVRWREQP
jgi:hypothetical protein